MTILCHVFAAIADVEMKYGTRVHYLKERVHQLDHL